MPEIRQVGFRFNSDEHPLLEEWLSYQKNKGVSIVYALERAIEAYGKDGDIIENVLYDEQANKINRGEKTE